MKGIIVYKSRYGATTQYATWLGNELNIPVVESENLEAGHLSSFDYVIVGSPVYMGKLLLKDWLKANERVLKNRKVYYFVVCASVGQEEKEDNIIRNNFSLTLRDPESIYFLPGRMIFKDLSWPHKLLVKIGAMLSKDENKRKVSRQDIDSVDWVNLQPLIIDVKRLVQFGKKFSAIIRPQIYRNR